VKLLPCAGKLDLYTRVRLRLGNEGVTVLRLIAVVTVHDYVYDYVCV